MISPLKMTNFKALSHSMRKDIYLIQVYRIYNDMFAILINKLFIVLCDHTMPILESKGFPWLLIVEKILPILYPGEWKQERVPSIDYSC